jgi:3-hydroxyisobutyrate dehydrogenase-like beta-hydroxyacid dehydrogenase
MDLRRVGVIGLGLMGTALGERLLRASYALRVWNRTPDKARPLVALGAAWSDNPLGECDRVLLCLYTSDTGTSTICEISAPCTARCWCRT